MICPKIWLFRRLGTPTAACLGIALLASAALAQPAAPGAGQAVPLPASHAPVPAAPADVAPPAAGDAVYSQGSFPRYTITETVFESIFPKHAPKREWTPLYASDFFSEGWLEPQIGPPSGSGGSLRQGWIGVPDAFFNRQIVFGIYSYADGANGRQDEQNAAFLIESPLSRRYDVGLIVPYLDNLQGRGRNSTSSFGDVIIENRFMLHETQDLTVSFNLNIRVPTGSTSTGNEQTAFNSYFAFYKDLNCNGWSIRGAFGIVDPVDGPGRDTTTLTQSLGIGQTITPHDVPLFGDFTYYLCFNAVEDLNARNNEFMSLTPGIRTHLGNDFFLLMGVDFPLTANAGFHERFNIVILKGF